MSKYIIKTDNVSNCCNLILWDFLITILLIFSLSNQYFPNLSTFQCFILGLVGGFLLIALMSIKFLQNLITFLFSIFWSLMAYELLDEIFHISNYHVLWRLGIGILCFFIILSIHLGSAEDLGMFSFSKPSHIKGRQTSEAAYTDFASDEFDEHVPNLQADMDYCTTLFKQAMEMTNEVEALFKDDSEIHAFVKKNLSKIIRKHNHLLQSVNKFNRKRNATTFRQVSAELSDTLLMIGAYIHSIKDLLSDVNTDSSNERQEQNTNTHNHSEIHSAFFNGCDTLDKINKRYRDLAKIYHTDSGNGDSDSFIKITEEYNYLKDKISR